MRNPQGSIFKFILFANESNVFYAVKTIILCFVKAYSAFSYWIYMTISSPYAHRKDFGVTILLKNYRKAAQPLFGSITFSSPGYTFYKMQAKSYTNIV